ncbi:helix-turn-helix domain-containing protein [Streptomyces niveus]|uniref:helix-turn-helix domain-containing protein n=1 Tax=Streptomyces niveus TaxID=193462 RepID=UPI0036A063EB
MKSTQTNGNPAADGKAPPSLGSLLKAARKRTGITQGQLADLSSVSVRAIRDLELDLTQNPRRETLRLILDGLRLTGARRAELEKSVCRPTLRDGLGALTPPPAALGPSIGREHDIRALTNLLESGGHRLVRVVGMAGVGKSRLVQEVAGAAYAGARMPVVWAETGGNASSRASEPLHGQIAALLRGNSELDSLVAAFGTSDILLVINGADLNSGAETALRRLLEQCPGLRVLCETHEVTRRSEGTDYPVFPLPVSDRRARHAAHEPDDDPAVQLMLSRCARLVPEAVSDPLVMAALAKTCWSLDGIPRAIEAAAAWLLLYEPDQLLDLATRDPFSLTTPPDDDAADLRTALKRSVESLPPRESETLYRLAAYPRPWTMAQVVSAPGRGRDSALSAIHLLCTRGLVRPSGRSGHGIPRFTVLNLVRHLLAEGISPAARTVAAVLPQQLPVPVDCDA